MSTQPEEKKTAPQAECVEWLNNFSPRHGVQDFRKCEGSRSEIVSKELARRKLFHRVEAVTACLQAGISLPMISFQHPIDHQQ